jgi:hypothetical protein
MSNSSNNNTANLANASLLFPNTKSQSGSYNWVGVLEFLQEQYRTLTYKETEWLLERQELQVDDLKKKQTPLRFFSLV